MNEPTTPRRAVPRPATPSPAERARTIATRGGRGALIPNGEEDSRIVPLLHHEHTDGSAMLLLDDDHPLVARVWHCPRGELGAMLEVADPTPVRLREPVRGLLWLTGWLRALEPTQARNEALVVSEKRPDPRLLDVGHGASALRLETASLVIADAESTCSVFPHEFASARPDPFCLLEDGWLRHLELSHRDVVGMLARHLPEELRGGHIRPLGLDKYGLRLRVESADGDHDVRLAFAREITDTKLLAAELRRLVGCPFLAEQR